MDGEARRRRLLDAQAFSRTRRTILDELQERDGQTLFELCIQIAAHE